METEAVKSHFQELCMSIEEIIARLEQVPLFSSVSRENRAKLAMIVKRTHRSPGAVIYRQGEPGTALYIVHAGEIAATALDERGETMPPRFFKEGDSWGETSLLLGEPHDATMRVKEQADLLFVEKADFERLLVKYPDIWRSLCIRTDVHLKLFAPKFSWLAADEHVQWFGRKHPIVLVRRLIVPLGLWFGSLIFLSLIRQPFSVPLFLGGMAIASVLFLPWAVWVCVDWSDDYHVVTDHRVAHVERVMFQYESRDEAPLDKVQNISTRRSALGSSLGYAQMSIFTAGGRGGRVDFRWVTEPEMVASVITEQIRRSKMRQRMEGREGIAQILQSHISPAQKKNWWEYQVPVRETQKRDVLSLMVKRRGCSSAITESALFSFLLRPHLPRLLRIIEGGNIIWRKHWAILLRGIALPLVAFAAALAFIAWSFSRAPGLVVPALLVSGAMLFWLTWQYEDWRNDLYILTPTQIIDIERTPFLFRESRRQASLENIQDIRYEIPGFWATMLNIGNVVIQTAGQGQFTFDQVFDPSAVQREIFLRIEDYRDRKRSEERRERESELGDWFEIYHQREQDENKTGES
jgi:uncharacterized membrane protein YdbT with pleckstrin-like domain